MTQSVFLIAMDIMEKDMAMFGSSWNRDNQLKGAVNDIIHSYRDANQRTMQSSSIDFSRPEFRGAYLFLYLASHVRIIERCFQRFWENSSAATSMLSWYTDIRRLGEEVHVCAIGGGPGTDVLGFFLFVSGTNWPVSIQGTVFDKWPQWAQCFHQMSQKLDLHGRIQTIKYKSFDYFQPVTYEMRQELASADLVTMVKFISAVAADRTFCRNKLKELLELMKPGACFFFMDNSGGGYREMAESAASETGLSLLNKISFEQFYIPSMESNEMYTYRNRIGISPQKSAKVAVILWQKPKFKNYNPIGDTIQYHRATTAAHLPMTARFMRNHQNYM